VSCRSCGEFHHLCRGVDGQGPPENVFLPLISTPSHRFVLSHLVFNEPDDTGHNGAGNAPTDRLASKRRDINSVGRTG